MEMEPLQHENREDDLDALEQFCNRNSERTERVTATFKNTPFNELCDLIKKFLRSPATARWYPPAVQHKHDKQNFRKRASFFKWNDDRQKLFRQHVDSLNLGK